MVNELTPEQIAQALNERKYLSRDNWQVMPGEECLAGGPNLERDIDIEDARAIIQGLQAQDELAELKARVTTPDRWMKWCDEQALGEIERLQAELERCSLTVEREMIACAIEQMELLDPSNTSHEQQKVYKAIERITEMVRARGRLTEGPVPLVEQPEERSNRRTGARNSVDVAG